MRKAKRARENMIAKLVKKNPKAFFQYVSSKIKTRDKVANLKQKDGTLTENDSQKSNVLNNFFASVFTHEDKNNLPTFNSCTNNTIDSIRVTEEDMYNALNNLNVNKSPGPDEIHPRILKDLARELSYPLKNIFYKTMEQGQLPSSWKLAEVHPIYKKGDRSTPGNYRPVSLTSVFCKIFEGYFYIL